MKMESMKRPFVAVNMAMTMDGRVMRPEGRWFGLTSQTDRNRMDEIRRRMQGILVGHRTLVRDNPVLWIKDQTGNPDPASPIPILICRNSLPPFVLRIFHGPVSPLLLVNRSLLSEKGLPLKEEFLLEDYVEDDIRGRVIALPREELHPGSVLTRLRSMNFEHLLLEGGPALNYAFFQEDLVDLFFLTLVPHVIGQSDLAGPVQGPSPLKEFHEKLWELTVCRQQENSEVFLEYRRRRPCPPEPSLEGL